jgi:hypothetical protein
MGMQDLMDLAFYATRSDEYDRAGVSSLPNKAWELARSEFECAGELRGSLVTFGVC